MLAEPRRKVKYGANPRGETWANGEKSNILLHGVFVLVFATYVFEYFDKIVSSKFTEGAPHCRPPCLSQDLC